MKKQFCNYKLSLELKKLGFNDKCLGQYEEGFLNLLEDNCTNKEWSEYDDCCAAPLWQQIIDWIKREHNICITQTPSIIVDSWIVVDSDSRCVGSFTKEQAILKALTLIK